jgi:hypothetical protein
VYSRACLSRTVALVVALSLTAVSTGAVARAFDAVEPTSEDLNRSNVAVALIGTRVPAAMLADIAPVSHYRTSAGSGSSVGFEAAMARIHAKAPRDGTADRTNSQGGVN